MIQFGKVITSESYFEGKQTNKQVTYSLPILVSDQSQLLSEIIKAIDLITNKQTHTLKLTISAGKNYQLKMITKEYLLENLTSNSTILYNNK